MRIRAFANALAWLALLVSTPCRADSLALYTFGDSLANATSAPDSVAPHLSATPVIGWDTQHDLPLDPSFFEDGEGSVAMRLNHATSTGIRFELELTAAAGYTFQVTDFLISLYQYNYSGGVRGIYVSANSEPTALLFQVAGGDGGAAVEPDAGVFGMKEATFDALAARTDLTSLWVGVAFGANGISDQLHGDLHHVSLDGNVIPVAEPSRAFLCYKAKSTKGDVCSAASTANAGAACDAEEDCGGSAETDLCAPNRPPKLQATLADPESAGTAVEVRKGAALCNPADVAGAGISLPDDHLRSFGIAVAKGAVPFPPRTGFTVTTAFGPVMLDTGKVDRLLVPAAKDLAAPVAAPEAPGVDHFRCAKVKVSRGAPRFEPTTGVEISDQFDQPALYELKKPTRLCSAVDKNGEGFVRPADLLLCYQAKRGKGQPKHVRVTGAHVAHQFAVERLDTVKEEELCVPSTAAPTEG